jgi:hypothetical protein
VRRNEDAIFTTAGSIITTHTFFAAISTVTDIRRLKTTLDLGINTLDVEKFRY